MNRACLGCVQIICFAATDPVIVESKTGRPYQGKGHGGVDHLAESAAQVADAKAAADIGVPEAPARRGDAIDSCRIEKHHIAEPKGIEQNRRGHDAIGRRDPYPACSRAEEIRTAAKRLKSADIKQIFGVRTDHGCVVQMAHQGLPGKRPVIGRNRAGKG